MESTSLHLNRNFRLLRQLIARAQCVALQNPTRACLYAQLATDFAWHDHPGVHADRELEITLRHIADAALPPHGPTRLNHPTTRRRVLHIITETNAIGGHTRLLQRWIESDRASTHSVLVTRQGYLPASDCLYFDAKTAVSVTSLSCTVSSPLKQALKIRHLVSMVDFVVLHNHPNDISPALALGGHQTPPVILMNHADHVFWAGWSVANVIANIRQSGMDACRKLRDIPSDHLALLPLPLVARHRKLPREEAKARLGITPETIVLLSVSSAYKFAQHPQADFVSMHAEIMLQHPHALHVVVGPKPLAQWKDAEISTSGRLRAVGRVTDPTLYYEAADIFVESFPFGSLTSVLEAIQFGIPVVSYDPFKGRTPLLMSGDPCLPKNFLIDSASQYRHQISRMIEDGEMRNKLGTALNMEFQKWHSQKSWQHYLEVVYDQAQNTPQLGMNSISMDGPHCNDTLLDQMLLSVHALTNFADGLDGSWRRIVPLYPSQTRLPAVCARLPIRPTSRLSGLIPHCARISAYRVVSRLPWLMNFIRNRRP